MLAHPVRYMTHMCFSGTVLAERVAIVMAVYW